MKPDPTVHSRWAQSGRRLRVGSALAAVVLALTALPGTAPAQDVAQSLELSREVVDEQKRMMVAGSLPLTDEQADAFWPLFDQFQTELKTIDGREDQLVAAFAAEYANLSDARARAMLDQALQIDEDRVKLIRAWVKRIEKALPPRLLVRYFQLENKFQAIVAADLARQIPLVP